VRVVVVTRVIATTVVVFVAVAVRISAFNIIPI
jgi:hypothetical protein